MLCILHSANRNLAAWWDYRRSLTQWKTTKAITSTGGGRLLLLSLVATLFAVGSSLGILKAESIGTSPVLRLLTSALGALSGGSPVLTDAVLTGTVTVTTKTKQTQGPVRFVSNASGTTRVEIDLPSGKKVETRRIADKSQAGESQVGSQATSPLPLHNLLIDPAWFFPEHLVSRALLSTRTTELLPATNMDDTIATGVDSYLSSAASHQAATLKQISEIKIFFDQKTSLPVEVQFNNHSNDSLTDIIPTRVVYGSYQSVQGHMVPFHIQQYEKGILHEDITIANVALNPGTATSEYSLR